MENTEFVFILSTSHNGIEKVTGALQPPTNMAAFDAKIDFFLMDEGAVLARKGFAGSVADLIKSPK